MSWGKQTLNMVNVFNEIYNYFSLNTEVGMRLMTMNLQEEMIELEPGFPYYEDGLRAIQKVKKRNINDFTIYCDISYYYKIYKQVMSSMYVHNEISLYIISNENGLSGDFPVINSQSEIIDIHFFIDMSDFNYISLDYYNNFDKIEPYKGYSENFQYEVDKDINISKSSVFDMINLRESKLTYPLSNYRIYLNLNSINNINSLDILINYLNAMYISISPSAGVYFVKSGLNRVEFFVKLIDFEYNFSFLFLKEFLSRFENIYKKYNIDIKVYLNFEVIYADSNSQMKLIDCAYTPHELSMLEPFRANFNKIEYNFKCK